MLLPEHVTNFFQECDLGENCWKLGVMKQCNRTVPGEIKRWIFLRFFNIPVGWSWNPSELLDSSWNSLSGIWHWRLANHVEVTTCCWIILSSWIDRHKFSRETIMQRCGVTKITRLWYGCFLKWWYPQNTPKWSFLVGKPMGVGYHHFRKPPYDVIFRWERERDWQAQFFFDFCFVVGHISRRKVWLLTAESDEWIKRMFQVLGIYTLSSWFWKIHAKSALPRICGLIARWMEMWNFEMWSCLRSKFQRVEWHNGKKEEKKRMFPQGHSKV